MKLKPPALAVDQPGSPFWSDAEARTSSERAPYAFVGRNENDGSLAIWIRRPRQSAGQPIEGDLYTRANDGNVTLVLRQRRVTSSASLAEIHASLLPLPVRPQSQVQE